MWLFENAILWVLCGQSTPQRCRTSPLRESRQESRAFLKETCFSLAFAGSTTCCSAKILCAPTQLPCALPGLVTMSAPSHGPETEPPATAEEAVDEVRPRLVYHARSLLISDPGPNVRAVFVAASCFGGGGLFAMPRAWKRAGAADRGSRVRSRRRPAPAVILVSGAARHVEEAEAGARRGAASAGEAGR